MKRRHYDSLSGNLIYEYMSLRFGGGLFQPPVPHQFLHLTNLHTEQCEDGMTS